MFGQAALAETPAGRAFTAWLAALNSGDLVLLRAFDDITGLKWPGLTRRSARRATRKMSS